MFGLHVIQKPGPMPHRLRPEAGGAWGGGAPMPADDRLSGFAEGTRVATLMGWREVESLGVGDLVLTFDHGPQPIRAMTRGRTPLPEGVDPLHMAPIEVPAGALGNRVALRLMPEQSVMLESDEAELLTGDPFALVPATALTGHFGIAPGVAAREQEIVTLHFDADEIVYAEGGALVLAQAALPGDPRLDLFERAMVAPYNRFSGAEARALVAALAHEDVRRRSVAPAAA